MLIEGASSAREWLRDGPVACDFLTRRARAGDSQRGANRILAEDAGIWAPPGFVAPMLGRVARHASRDEFELSDRRFRDGSVLGVFHAEPVVSRFSAAA